MDLYEELSKIIQDHGRVTQNEVILKQHSKGMTSHEGHMPDIVVFPISKEEISQIIQFAHHHEIPVVPFGAGSSLEGQIIPIHGGIVLDTSLMDQIVDISPGDMIVKVHPGVTRRQLNNTLLEYQLYFPINTEINATIGGMTATNASGANSVNFGTMRDQVLGLEVVTGNGEILQVGGSYAKSASGYNLTSLLVGSEGTLGIFTEIVLKLQPLPEMTVVAKASFKTIQQAIQAGTKIIQSGVPISKLDLLDSETIQFINEFRNENLRECPTLYMNFNCKKATKAQHIQDIQAIVKAEKSIAFEYSSDELEMQKLWEARKQVYFTAQALNRGKEIIATDICVPISKLAEAITEIRAILNRNSLKATIYSHVGDGTIHAIIAVDTDDLLDQIMIDEVRNEIIECSLNRNGTVTAEYGIGLRKKPFFIKEHGKAVDMMKAIKNTLDPKNILNPGKIF